MTSDDGGRAWVTTTRRVLLGVVVLALAVGLVVGGVPTVCRDVALDAGVGRVCEPMGLGDLRVWAVLLVVALLLLPELAEIELAGVLTLRRRLDEMRGETAELRGEIAHIRTQAMAAAQSVASTSSTVRVDVRQGQTGAALAEVTGQDDGVLDTAEEAGAYRQLAFEAGMVGLAQLFSGDAGGVALIGYTVGDDGELEPTYFTGDVADDDLRDVTREVNDVRTDSDVGILALADGYALLAAAGARRVLGALVVLVRGRELPSPAELESPVADLQAAAAAYSRLLVDLLGEGSARSAGE